MIVPVAPGVAIDECPLMHPKSRGRRRPPWQTIFCRLPGGELQRPSPEELLGFCALGRYHACPIYRRAIERQS